MPPYVVGVHGIRNYSYFRAAGTAEAATLAISDDWTSWLGGAPVSVGYYAHHLHRGTPQGPDYVPDGLAADLLLDWMTELRPGLTPQGDKTARVRAALDWLNRKGGPAMRLFATAFVRELAAYLGVRSTVRRQAARAVVIEAIAAASEQERVVVVAHSLGSVVTYEALWAAPHLRVDLLVTLGSPLGMRSVVFDRLDPRPAGRGARPPGVRSWVNLADVGDLVAVPRAGLGGSFDGVDADYPELRIARWDFHTVRSYLGCPDVARHLTL